MKQTTAIVEVWNGSDIILVRNKLLSKTEIRCITIEVHIQSKSYPVCLNEEIAQKLKLSFVEKRMMTDADGNTLELDVANNVDIRVNDHSTTCRAVILPGNSKPIISSALFDYLTLPYTRI